MEQVEQLQLLNPQELGKMLSISPRTIYNRHNIGGDLPPAMKIGKSLRFPVSGVQAWLASKLVATHAPIAAPTPTPAPRKRGRPTKAEQIARRSAQPHAAKTLKCQ
jgi:predicted DNA-binding transcriptional regulator AlpA